MYLGLDIAHHWGLLQLQLFKIASCPSRLFSCLFFFFSIALIPFLYALFVLYLLLLLTVSFPLLGWSYARTRIRTFSFHWFIPRAMNTAWLGTGSQQIFVQGMNHWLWGDDQFRWLIIFSAPRKKTLSARDRLGKLSGRGSLSTTQDVLASVQLTSGQRVTGHVAECGSLHERPARPR